MINITAIDYDSITDLNTTNNITVNCTDNENNFVIVIPTLLLTVPRGLAVLCLLSLSIYTLFKPLITIK